MGERARRLARSVWELGLKAEPWREIRAMVLEERAEIAPLVELLLQRPPRNCVFLDAALSFLPEGDWPHVVRQAIRALQAAPSNRAAESVVRYASLQAPRTLEPHLEALFAVSEYFKSYDGPYAWRAAGNPAIDFLETRLRSGRGDEAKRAYRCLLEIRTPRAIDLALAAAPRPGREDVPDRRYLQEVGLELVGRDLRFLYRPEPLHLLFAPAYLDPPPDHTLKDLHPTWVADPVDRLETIQFGGPAREPCPVCDRTAHHLLTLPVSRLMELVTSLPSLTLDTCLSCLGWTVPSLWFRHDPSGGCAPVAGDLRRPPEFPAEPFARTEATIARTLPRWHWQD